jgi:hypothetical protein
MGKDTYQQTKAPYELFKIFALLKCSQKMIKRQVKNVRECLNYRKGKRCCKK